MAGAVAVIEGADVAGAEWVPVAVDTGGVVVVSEGSGGADVGSSAAVSEEGGAAVGATVPGSCPPTSGVLLAPGCTIWVGPGWPGAVGLAGIVGPVTTAEVAVENGSTVAGSGPLGVPEQAVRPNVIKTPPIKSARAEPSNLEARWVLQGVPGGWWLIAPLLQISLTMILLPHFGVEGVAEGVADEVPAEHEEHWRANARSFQQVAGGIFQVRRCCPSFSPLQVPLL